MTGVTRDARTDPASRGERNPAVHSVSGVVYCRNGTTRIGAVVHRLRRALIRCDVPFEIIVVDNGSTDGSGEVLKQLQETIPQLRVVRLSRGQDYGAALRSGLRAASFEWVYCAEIDTGYDVEEVLTLVGAAAADIDWVQGRELAEEGNWIERLLRFGFVHLAVLILGVGSPDTACSYRLIRRSFLDRLGLCSTSGALCVEMVVRGRLAGARVVAVPLRRSHHSYLRSLHVVRMSPEILRLRLRLMVFDRLRS